jgi:hypothetical protein
MLSDAGHPPRLVESYMSTYFDGTQIPGIFEFFKFLFSLDDDTAVDECMERATKLAEELHK